MAQFAIFMTTIMGFMALTVDVGHMYNTKAELQRTADAAALYAASVLGDWTDGNPLAKARDAAQTAATLNTVFGKGTRLGTGDVVFGTAYIDDMTNRYVFTPDPGAPYPNAVQVRVRRTEGSQTTDGGSGEIPLFFARVLGIADVNMAAQATAVLTPRDLAFVLDLSTSHNDDSSLRSFKHIDIANKEVFDDLSDTDSAWDPQLDGLGFRSGVNVVDNGDGTSTVSVSLTSEDASKALSHVTFGLPEGAEAMVMGTAATDGDYEAPEWGMDPASGVYGVKFNSIGDGLGEDGAVETHNFSFSMDNALLSQTQMTVATKAGPTADTSVAYMLDPQVRIGNLREWGTEVTGPGWDWTADEGLVQLTKNSNWNVPGDFISQTAADRGFGAYSSSELDIINRRAIRPHNSRESTTDYKQRVKVALGIDLWLGDLNGNGFIDGYETAEMIPYPNQPTNPDTLSKQLGGSWDQFINYVTSSNSSMSKYDPSRQFYGDPGLRNRFGLKTFVDYLQEQEYGATKSPGLAGSPQEPMHSVAEAVSESLSIINQLQGGDLVGVAAYAKEGYGPDEKPNDLSWLTSVGQGYELLQVQGLIDQMQPGMWTNTTNVAQGIDEGVQVLFESESARPFAAKVLFLLTDGIANQTRNDPTYYNEGQARLDALDAAADARAQGVRIYTISVGSNADTELMKQIADPNYDPDDPDYLVSNYFHAEGTIDNYRSQLQTIFRKLGGERPVVLIE